MTSIFNVKSTAMAIKNKTQKKRKNKTQKKRKNKKAISKAHKEIKAEPKMMVEGTMFNCESTEFCLDVSGSMRSGHRLSTLKAAFRRFIERRAISATAKEDKTGVILFPLDYHSCDSGEMCTPGFAEEMIGMVGRPLPTSDQIEAQELHQFFGTHPSRVVRRSYDKLNCEELIPLSNNLIGLADRFDRIEARGCTPMSDGLLKAIDVLDMGAEGIARIILMSDGQPNDGVVPDFAELVALSRAAKDKYGIIIDTVAISTGFSDAVSVQLLKNMAAAAGGTFVEIIALADFEKFLVAKERERNALVGHGVLCLPGETGGK